jgi:hypothetical protein
MEEEGGDRLTSNLGTNTGNGTDLEAGDLGTNSADGTNDSDMSQQCAQAMVERERAYS